MALGSNRPRFRVLDLVTTVAILVTCGFVIWSSLARPRSISRPRPDIPIPSAPQSLSGTAVAGSPAAKVAVIEYSEYQCPYCGVFARDVWPALERDYINAGKVRFVFRHFPLVEMHPLALKAAHAAECAGAQGRFWDMSAALFLRESRLTADGLRERGAALKMDSNRFIDCLAGEVPAQVALDMESGKALAVNATPTFFLGRIEPTGDSVKISKVIVGAQPLGSFRKALEELLRPG